GKRFLNDADDVTRDVLHLCGLEFAGGAVRKSKYLSHQPNAARPALLERVEDLKVARSGQATAQQRLCEHDRGEHVVEVVGDARSEHADGLEPLGMEEFFLQQFFLGNVSEEVK